MTIYQKALNVYGMLRAAIDSRMSKHDIASQFDPEVQYSPGDLVIYQDKIYKCLSGHHGAWGDGEDFVRATLSDAMKSYVDSRVGQAAVDMALKTDIAEAYSPLKAYAPGSMVIYENILYRCISPHAVGEWNNADFVEATVDETIEAVRQLVMADVAELLEDKAEMFDLGMGMFHPGQWVFSCDGVSHRILAGFNVEWNGDSGQWTLRHADESDPIATLDGYQDATALTFENVSISGLGIVTIVAGKTPSNQIKDRCVNVIEITQEDDYTFYLPPKVAGKARAFYVYVKTWETEGETPTETDMTVTWSGYLNGEEEPETCLFINDGMINISEGFNWNTDSRYLFEFREVGSEGTAAIFFAKGNILHYVQ